MGEKPSPSGGSRLYPPLKKIFKEKASGFAMEEE